MARVWRILAEILFFSEKIKPSQDAKRRVLKKYGLLGSHVDRFLTKLFYEILRRQGPIDRAIEFITGARHVNLLDPWLRAALRVSVYLELFSSDKLTRSIIKDMKQWIRENTHPGAAIQYQLLINELRSKKENIFSILDEYELKYLVPRWFIDKITELIGGEAELLFKKLMEIPKLSVRVNILKTTVEEVENILRTKYKKKVIRGRYVDTVLKFEGPFNFDKSKEFRNGLFVVQDEASALASILLDPKPGQVVVDMCAAPGGKTEHMAELMRVEGTIYAFDIDKERIKRMKEILERTGTSKIVKIYMEDARKASEILGMGFVDKVMLDAPCTSDGTIAKNPELRWRIRESKVREIVELQKKLLLEASKLVKVGGEILYCTCSMLREENEDVVQWFLRRNSNFRLVSLPEVGSPGFLSGTRRMWPHLHDTIGFFYAKLKRIR